ncbi:MAG: RnfABCDGE type electron transport complex subunit G, partial [Myxococcales bacterium]
DVFVLTLICAVAAGVLAYIFTMTKEPIAQAREKVTLAAVQTVLPEFEKLADAAACKAAIAEADAPEMYAAFQGGKLVGAAIQITDPGGFGGDVTFMIGVTADAKVHAIRLLSHKETPGLGTKLAEEKFASQFKGISIPEGGLKVTKDGGTIQAITGATISSRTATRSATRAVELFTKYQQRLASVATSAAPAQGGPRG